MVTSLVLNGLAGPQGIARVAEESRPSSASRNGKALTSTVFMARLETCQILICDFCETSVGLAADSAEANSLKHSRMWTTKDGLNALVERTNPTLGHIAVTDKPGRQELFALLESMNERASPYKIKSDPGIAMGMLIGVPAFAVLGLLLSLLGVTGLEGSLGAVVGGFIGLFVGSLVGAIKFKCDYSKQLIEELLVAAMQRNALTLSTMQRALKHYPAKLKYVSWELTQLAADASVPPPVESRKSCEDCRVWGAIILDLNRPPIKVASLLELFHARLQLSFSEVLEH